jgi:hypothetical protein
MSAPRLPRGFAGGLAPPLFFFSVGPPDSPTFLSLNLSVPLAGVGILGLGSRMTRTTYGFSVKKRRHVPLTLALPSSQRLDDNPATKAETKWLMLCSNA